MHMQSLFLEGLKYIVFGLWELEVEIQSSLSCSKK